MLPRANIQEQLSLAYVQAISALAGCVVDRPIDYGVDLWLGYLTRMNDGGRRDFGHKIGIQAKATTDAEVSGTLVRYALEAKAYRDLTASRGLPRILVLYVMPKGEEQWAQATEDELILRRCAYWEYLRGRAPSDNQSSVTIEIPRSRRFDVAAVQGPLRKLAMQRRLP